MCRRLGGGREIIMKHISSFTGLVALQIGSLILVIAITLLLCTVSLPSDLQIILGLLDLLCSISFALCPSALDNAAAHHLKKKKTSGFPNTP